MNGSKRDETGVCLAHGKMTLRAENEYAPARRSPACHTTPQPDSLGLLPADRESELMMGMKMPPARAVVEGMAGAISASATDSLQGNACRAVL